MSNYLCNYPALQGDDTDKTGRRNRPDGSLKPDSKWEGGNPDKNGKACTSRNVPASDLEDGVNLPPPPKKKTSLAQQAKRRSSFQSKRRSSMYSTTEEVGSDIVDADKPPDTQEGGEAWYTEETNEEWNARVTAEQEAAEEAAALEAAGSYGNFAPGDTPTPMGPLPRPMTPEPLPRPDLQLVPMTPGDTQLRYTLTNMTPEPPLDDGSNVEEKIIRSPGDIGPPKALSLAEDLVEEEIEPQPKVPTMSPRNIRNVQRSTSDGRPQ
jgi:hypothetical protein